MPTDRGDITLRLRFTFNDQKLTNRSGSRPETGVEGQLQVVVSKARGLFGIQSNGLSDPFCIW